MGVTPAIRRVARAVLAVALVAVAVIAAAGPAPAQPLPLPLPLPVTVSRGDVVIRAEAGLEGLAAQMARRAPETLARIRGDLAGLAVPERIEIRLVKRARDMSRAAPPGRGAPEWASGVAYTDAGVAVVATRRESQSIEVAGVVDHEIAHLALGVALEGRAPRWLNEGFAYLHSSDLSVARVQILTGMVWFGDPIPLDRLDHAFAGSQGDVDRAYAQSYDFVAFLASRGRYADPDDDGNRWPFRQFLAEIAAGEAPYSAAQNAYGATLGQLYDEWSARLHDRYLLMPAGLFALGVWVVGALLLVLAYARRRLQNRRTLARWDDEEQAQARAAAGRADPLTAEPGPKIGLR